MRVLWVTLAKSRRTQGTRSRAGVPAARMCAARQAPRGPAVVAGQGVAVLYE